MADDGIEGWKKPWKANFFSKTSQDFLCFFLSYDFIFLDEVYVIFKSFFLKGHPDRKFRFFGHLLKNFAAAIGDCQRQEKEQKGCRGGDGCGTTSVMQHPQPLRMWVLISRKVKKTSKAKQKKVWHWGRGFVDSAGGDIEKTWVLRQNQRVKRTLMTKRRRMMRCEKCLVASSFRMPPDDQRPFLPCMSSFCRKMSRVLLRIGSIFCK